MTRRPRDVRYARILTAAITAFYVVLGLVLLAPEGVYSGDIGVKYVQARALASSHFRSLDLPYPGTFLDPSREFFPLRPPFVMTVGGETQAIFPPAAAALQAPFVAGGGIRGMVVLSIVSAFVILLACSAMALPATKTAVVLAVGLAGPLWSYAVLGWEHAPAVALSTVGFTIAMISVRESAMALAGLCLGAGALLRDEVLLLVPGLLLLAFMRHRSWRVVLRLCAAAAVPVLLGMAVEWLWFARPPGAHLRHAVTIAGSSDANDGISGALPQLLQLTLAERYETVIEYWLFGYGNNFWIAVFTATLGVALVVRWWFRSTPALVPLLLWLTGVLALAAADLWELATAPKWLAGLHRVSPYLVFAVLPAPVFSATPIVSARRSPYGNAILVTATSFLLLAFATTNTTGGKSLGPRLLLPLLPLLAVSAIDRIKAYVTAPSIMEKCIGAAGVALVAIGIGLHAAGTIPAYYTRNQEDAATVLTAAAAPARVIVADDPYTAQLLFPLYYRKIIFLADSREARARLAAKLADARVPEVLLMSRRPQPGTRLSPLRLRQSDKVGRMYIQYWGRVGRILE